MRFAYLIEPPFNYVDAKGWVTGCDVEVARYVSAQLGSDTFQPIEADFAALLPGVAEGRWRMTTGLFGTQERRLTANFSRPIWALPDGLLVRAGNPYKLDGYRSIAECENVQLAVIRDQIQHLSAMEFGVPSDRIFVFETYYQAAAAVREGHVDVYVSVARAHIGFMAQNPDWKVEIVPVPLTEKQPAFGSFAFALNDVKLSCAVDEILAPFLGCTEHRDMVRGFGMRDAEVDLIMDVKP